MSRQLSSHAALHHSRRAARERGVARARSSRRRAGWRTHAGPRHASAAATPKPATLPARIMEFKAEPASIKPGESIR